MSKPYLTIREVAGILGMEYQAAYYWVRKSGLLVEVGNRKVIPTSRLIREFPDAWEEFQAKTLLKDLKD